MATDTINFNDMTDTDWINLVDKPVMIGLYQSSDDFPITQFVGNLVSVSITPEVTKFTVGDRTGFFKSGLAYGLISFEGWR